MAEHSGDPKFELLRDPFTELLTDTETLVSSLWRAHQPGRNPLIDLPGLSRSIMAARVPAALALYRRSEMPVVNEDDLQALRDDLLMSGIAGEANCVITPREAKPSQCQIYLDKSLTGTAKAGISGTLEFLADNHLVITQDGFIVDGHHRWMSAWLIDADMLLPAFRIPADYVAVRPEIMRFSDSRHDRNQ